MSASSVWLVPYGKGWFPAAYKAVTPVTGL